MSTKDIRSFFKPVSKPSNSTKTPISSDSQKSSSNCTTNLKEESFSKQKKSKKKIVLSSDSDSENLLVERKVETHTKKEKTQISSDSEDFLAEKKIKTNPKKVRKVSSSDSEDFLAEKNIQKTQSEQKIEVISSDSDSGNNLTGRGGAELINKEKNIASKTPVNKRHQKNSPEKHNRNSPSSKVPVKKSHPQVNLKKLSSRDTAVKRLINIVDSDSDDSNIINATPDNSSKTKKKKYVVDSDSEEEKFPLNRGTLGQKGKKNVQEKLKPVSVTDIFSKTVKQSQTHTASNPLDGAKKHERKEKKKKTEVGIHEDKAFEKTLIDLDDDEIFLQNEDILDKTLESVLQKSPSKGSSDKKEESVGSNDNSMKEKSDVTANKSENSTIDKTVRKRPLDQEKESKDDTPSKFKKKKIEHTDSGIDDQERFERKRYCAAQYQQYLNRTGPKNHGCKMLPKGKPDCLVNLCFLRTGVLDSLESEEFEDLIKQHGGRTVHTVSKKVNYVVVGEDAGPAKLQKAENYHIPTISEDELLDMILQKSGLPKKYTIAKSSSFEESGISDSFKSSESEESIQAKRQNVKKKTEHMEVDTHEDEEATIKMAEEKKTLDKKIEEESRRASEASKQYETLIEKVKLKNESKEDESKMKKSLLNSGKTEEEVGTLDVCLSEKYKPKELGQIVGQQMNNSNMNKLKNWLEKWYSNEKLRKQNKITQPKPWDKTNDGAFYKCALLSGPPGVGKTTTATLVSECLGFDIVEFNASDTRSKKLLQQELASALSTQNISSFNIYSRALDKKRVILMDEVDGMAGNEDRGGMQELIILIKSTKIPIICMCNDRNHQKIRSLANYCYDLRFEKPKPQQILGFIMSICCKEGIKITPQVASEIINGTTCDIRQTLNQISMISNLDTGLTLAQAQKESAAAKKDTVFGPWQVCKMVFNEADQKNMSLIDKSRLFFYDYSLGPLFVQENYLKVEPHVDSKMKMKHVAAAAEAISMGATIDKKIRESNNWSLLDMQSIYSSVLPGHYMSGHFTSAIDFPGWLGKNSKRNKLKRMNAELAMHTKIQTTGGALAMNLDYSKSLLRSIVTPLKKKGLGGVSDAVEVMKLYRLLREDFDNLAELCTWPNQKKIMDGIDSKVKAAFTRLYNKEVPIFSYSANTKISKKKASALYDDEELNGEENEDLSESEETVENDTLIKAKTKSKNPSKKDSAKPSSSKRSSNPKGKGKK